MDRVFLESRRGVVVVGILSSAEFGELIPLPELVEIDGEACTVHVAFGRAALALDHDRAPLPPAAREALRLPAGACFADAVAALRERWGEPIEIG